MELKVENKEENKLENQEEDKTMIDNAIYYAWRRLQSLIDRLAIYPCARWLIALIFFSVFVYRAAINDGMVYATLGFHVLSYFLGLYMLDKFLGFISPKDEEDVLTYDGTVLPTREGEEFKPFKRAVKELDLWYSQITI